MNILKYCTIALTLSACLTLRVSAEAGLRVSGSTTVNPVVSEAAEALREEKGLRITIDTAGGSTGGINALGDGRADIGMSSRGLKDSDRKKFSSVAFYPTAIGQDAVSMVVSADVWNHGVRSLTANQIRDIYEGTITNWKQVGGPDQRVVFLNREPGRGEWEVFTKFLYPNQKKAPRTNHAMVGGNEETRNKTGATRGAVTFLSTPWADGKRVFPLAIKDAEGEVIDATGANIASGTYPMSRPLFVITNGTPAGTAKVLIDYLLSEPGQKLVGKHGYLKLTDLE